MFLVQLLPSAFSNTSRLARPFTGNPHEMPPAEVEMSSLDSCRLHAGMTATTGPLFALLRSYFVRSFLLKNPLEFLVLSLRGKHCDCLAMPTRQSRLLRVILMECHPLKCGYFIWIPAYNMPE